MGNTQPTPEQFSQFTGLDHDGPIVMLNVLKFKDRAVGEDGTGAQAYGRYGDAVTALVAEYGGRVVYAAPVLHTLIGEDRDEFDAIALIEYPSRQAFFDMIADPAYGDAHRHREAGLAYQLLIATDPTGTGAFTARDDAAD